MSARPLPAADPMPRRRLAGRQLARLPDAIARAELSVIDCVEAALVAPVKEQPGT